MNQKINHIIKIAQNQSNFSNTNGASNRQLFLKKLAQLIVIECKKSSKNTHTENLIDQHFALFDQLVYKIFKSTNLNLTTPNQESLILFSKMIIFECLNLNIDMFSKWNIENNFDLVEELNLQYFQNQVINF